MTHSEQMKKEAHTKIPVQFVTKTNFELALTSQPEVTGIESTGKLLSLKDHLSQEEQTDTKTEDSLLSQMLAFAKIEASALAWSTDFPHLFLPELLKEKTESARKYVERQVRIQRETQLQAAA